MDSVVKRTWTMRDFRLESGVTLPELTLAYESYGRLAADGRNAILVTHGFTSSQHAAGRHAPGDEAAGWWDGLIGPGKAIDTDRYFVVASNMLGSSYGSTAPATVNAGTGRPYGPDFPDITLVDIVNAQKTLLDHLGVKHLVAVAGPSFGGYQTYQWGVTYPDFMDGLVAVVSAPKGSGGEAAVKSLVDFLAKDPNWNGGWYYDNGGIAKTLEELRFETLMAYGQNEILAETMPDPKAREAAIRGNARAWAQIYDGHSMVALRKAIGTFDITGDYAKLRNTKVLYVQSPSDKLFDIAQSPGYVSDMRRAGIDITYVELPTNKGHMASHADAALWAPILGAFLRRLQ
jgi:homoserine O-acetyltransferase